MKSVDPLFIYYSFLRWKTKADPSYNEDIKGGSQQREINKINYILQTLLKKIAQMDLICKENNIFKLKIKIFYCSLIYETSLFLVNKLDCIQYVWTWKHSFHTETKKKKKKASISQYNKMVFWETLSIVKRTGFQKLHRWLKVIQMTEHAVQWVISNNLIYHNQKGFFLSEET